MENVRKHRDINLVTTKTRGDYLVSEPNYYTIKKVFRKSFSNRNEKSKDIIKKPVYSVLTILEIHKIVMYEFW